MKMKIKMGWCCVLSLLVILVMMRGSSGEDCGGEVLCSNDLCCSEWGVCGSDEDHCDPATCQSNCWSVAPSAPPPAASMDITDVINSTLFDLMLLHRNDISCPGRGFYTYDAFITAARFFPAFGNTGNTTIRKKELAAFFGQTAFETNEGWDTAPGGYYAWGYCFVNASSPSHFCIEDAEWPCAVGKYYYPRGPIQLEYNTKYGPAGQAIGVDLLNDPDLVGTDPVISFKTAIWFWMNSQGSTEPSCHDVITDNWTPSSLDIENGRLPGYGVITNIINDDLECGNGANKSAHRIGFYTRNCGSNIFDVSPGDNLDCDNQTPFERNQLLLNSM